MRAASAVVVALVVLALAPALAEIIDAASVIDGDTIEIHGQLVRPHGIARGHSDAVHVEKGRPRSATDMTLTLKHVIQPPILAALPLLVVQSFAGARGPIPEWCERMQGG